jgi:hypothetical protein
MEVHDRLNELTAMVRDAKTMPMSGACRVNRTEMLDILEGMRKALPANLHDAQALLSDREAVQAETREYADHIQAEAREQAERIVAGARAERERLIEESEILAAARASAREMVAEAQAKSATLLAGADQYVDRKLAEFEVILVELGSQVSNGRMRLTARREVDQGKVVDPAFG